MLIIKSHSKTQKYLSGLIGLSGYKVQHSPKGVHAPFTKFEFPSERDTSLLYPDQTFLGVALTSGSQVVRKTKFRGQRTSLGIETVLKIILLKKCK